MSKPTLFFSHSSRDKTYMGILKKLIHDKTSGTLEIFLSSDGQSIPFGANWVHSIEAALEQTSVMFVAVSPQSVGTPWIYFEAGYTYSRNISVVPIGILGFSIERLSPPLSLLQGFNIGSHHGLNNIIATINRKYRYSFPEDFTDRDYDELKVIEGPASGSFGKYEYFLDYIALDISNNIKSTTMVSNIRERVRRILDDNQLRYIEIDESTMMMSGMRLETRTKKEPNGTTTQRLALRIDPLQYSEGISLIKLLFGGLYEPPPTKFWFHVCFQPTVDVLTTDFKVSSRLAAVGVPISPRGGKLFQYRNVLFAMDKRVEARSGYARGEDVKPSLRIVGDVDDEREVPLLDLLDLLIDARVIKLPNA